jgi:hypothetical protein
MKEPYKNWAEGHIEKVRGVLNAARSEHTQAVKERIGSVEQMKDVVSITEGLFALSKETAKLENEAFVQKQKVALATELKAVLDSWVRFEQQQKESEQADLAKTVIDNVLKSIKDEKTQKDILLGAVAEVERECAYYKSRMLLTVIPLSSLSTSFSRAFLHFSLSIVQSLSRARLSRLLLSLLLRVDKDTRLALYYRYISV